MRQDYVVRLVRRAVQMLQLIVGAITFKQWDEARRLLHGAYREFFGLEASFIHAVEVEQLVRMLDVGGVLDAERCLLLAALLRQEGELDAHEGATERAYHLTLRALLLQLAVFERGQTSTLPAEWVEIEASAAALATYELPPAVQPRLLRYYEEVGRYDQAENLLWEWLAATEGDPTVTRQGIAFYERLLQQEEAGLAAGGLPRAEVAAGLAELRARQGEGPDAA